MSKVFSVAVLKEPKEETKTTDYTQGKLVDEIRAAHADGQNKVNITGRNITSAIRKFFTDGGFKVTTKEISWE